MRAAADTSALIALAACDGLDLLDALFREVRVPPAVFGETTVSHQRSADVLTSYLQDKVVQVSVTQAAVVATGLGRGEIEAIALCKVEQMDVLLVDDAQARWVARCHGLRVSGSLGVLLKAKRQGLIAAIRPLVERARAAGIYYSDELVAEALQLAGET